jgi:hypothetical protein
MSLRVAFVGPAKAGKSTASQYLARRYGTTTVSFAAPVKRELFKFLTDYRYAGMNGSKDRFMQQHKQVFDEGPCFGEASLPPMICSDPIAWINANKDNMRQFLQWWGTDYRRAQDENYWVNQLRPLVEEYDALANDDCRFLNEAEYLVSAGFRIVAINPATPEEAKNLHSSEREYLNILDQYPHTVIHNPKTEYEVFYRVLDDLFVMEPKKEEAFVPSKDTLRFN